MSLVFDKTEEWCQYLLYFNVQIKHNIYQIDPFILLPAKHFIFFRAWLTLPNEGGGETKNSHAQSKLLVESKTPLFFFFMVFLMKSHLCERFFVKRWKMLCEMSGSFKTNLKTTHFCVPQGSEFLKILLLVQFLVSLWWFRKTMNRHNIKAYTNEKKKTSFFPRGKCEIACRNVVLQLCRVL